MGLSFKTILLSVCIVMLIQFDGLAQNNTMGEEPITYHGTASYYSSKFNGRKTASGEIFDQSKLTGASNKVPLGTWVKVTNVRNGRSVVVKINDRMSNKVKRVVDLSYSSAKKLGFLKAGITKVEMQVLPDIDDVED